MRKNTNKRRPPLTYVVPSPLVERLVSACRTAVKRKKLDPLDMAAFKKLLAEIDDSEKEQSELHPYRETARGRQVFGEIEVDDNAVVSLSEDGGAYVGAWMWIDAEDARVCATCAKDIDVNAAQDIEGKKFCDECAEMEGGDDEEA